MSKTIDQRVVEMRFDNSKFESNVQTSMSTLDKLKQKLNLRGASKGLEEVGKASKSFNMNGVASAVETVQARFSALQVVGVTALANIANQAVNTGKRMISALTIDPIKTGFQEYETQMGSIQTILANTESKGSTLQDVNRALAELNEYADKTIYNFTEMTRNIGTFTAAGVDLETSVSSIKGIANLAAISGSTSVQASTAMYQLSQALAAGRVSLMDWNSVVNAGMGGEVFQTALKRTAQNMGTNVDAIIEKYGSFRESLTQGNWLTTEVLTETLTQLSGAYSKADLIAQGYTEEQANQITKLADTAVSAATEVKTFTQLWDTLKEAAQSGWAQTWQTVVGDFGEAKEMLTGINNVVSGIISSSAESRNKLLTEGLSTGWKQLLKQGIDDEDRFKESIKSVAKERGLAIDKMIEDAGSFEKMLKSGKITGDMLTEALDNMTTKVSEMSQEELKAAGYTDEQVKKLKELNKAVKDGSISMDEFAKKMVMPSGRENLIAGMANIFKTLGAAIAPVKEAFRDIFPPMTGDQLYEITEKFRELTEQFKISEETASKIKRTFSGVFAIFDLFGKAIKTVLSPLGDFATGGGLGSLVDIILNITAAIGDFFTTVNNSTGVENFFSGMSQGLQKAIRGISEMLDFASNGFGSFGDVISTIGDIIGNIIGKIGDGIKWLSDNLSFGDIFAGLAGGGIFMAAKKFGNLFDTIKEKISGLFDKKESKGLLDSFKEFMGSLQGTLASFTTGIKATTLLTIAGAIGILSMSLRSMSEIDATNLIKGLSGVGALLFMLNNSFKTLTETLSKFKGGGTIKAGLALIAMAASLNIMSSALAKMGSLDLVDLAKGLGAIGTSLFMMQEVLKTMGKSNISLQTSVGIIALAQACKMIGDALANIGKLGWEEIAKGLTGMGAALAELVFVFKYMDKLKGDSQIKNAAAILIVVHALNEIADALSSIGKLSWGEIARGLTGIGGALAELVIALKYMNALENKGSMKDAASILIAVHALDEIAESLTSISNISWNGIAKGLVGIGGVLTELVLVFKHMDKLQNGSNITDAAAILIAAQALNNISEALVPLGSISWNGIVKGLVGIGGVFTEMSLVLGYMNSLKNTGSIVDAASIWIVAQTLGNIANALIPISSLSWGEIVRGLAGMGGALLEIGAVLGGLSALASAGGGIGAVAELVAAGSLWLAIQGLTELATALQQFGSMSWDEIGRGLTAMIGAMGATGLGALANTLSGLGALNLNIAVQPLNDLAESLQKFGEMSWDEIDRGISAMVTAMGATGIGGLANTLSGLGALSIATIAEPLGTLADSVKKWVDVKVPPDLGTQLGSLAGGIMEFTFSGWGAGAIAEVATPLGTLATSIQKWAGVNIPEGLGEQLKTLAPGIGAFNFSGWGADAIAALAEPLGMLATSVSKWASVEVREDMATVLTSLATGVRAFNFAGWGADDIAEIATPLGDLATSIQKWSGVEIPEEMGPRLTSLATGIKAFNKGLFEGESKIGDYVVPIGDLAGAVAKWNGITIIDNLGTNVGNLAEGIKKFNGVGTENISSVATAVKDIGTAVTSISNVNFSSVATGLQSFATSINSLKVSSDSFSKLGSDIVNSLVNALNSGQARVRAAAQSLANSTVSSFNAAVSGAAAKSSSAGRALANGLVSGMKAGVGLVKSAATSIVNSGLSAINSKNSAFQTAGRKLATSLTNGIKSAANGAKSAVTSMVNSAASAASSANGRFRSAGYACASGFAAGIRSGAYSAQLAAAAMASAASEAARRNLKINSPSKVFREIGSYVPQGFAQGIGMMGNLVKSSAGGMADTAINSASKAISRVSEIINSDMVDTQPTIRPVVDLDNVYAGARAINGALSLNPSVGVLSNVRAISSAMNSRNQNGVNSDVVDAIERLDRSIRKSSGNTYNLGNIEYARGSEVADAIETLVRAARIDGRS